MKKKIACSRSWIDAFRFCLISRNGILMKKVKKTISWIFSVVVRATVEVEPKNCPNFVLNKMGVMDFGGWVQMPVLPSWWIRSQKFWNPWKIQKSPKPSYQIGQKIWICPWIFPSQIAGLIAKQNYMITSLIQLRSKLF